MAFKTPKNSTQRPSKSTDKPQANADFKSRQSYQWVVKDAVVLASIGLSFFLFLILYSYSPSDPSFDSVEKGVVAENYGGHSGAWLSSGILYLFGIFGFVLPFGILLAGVLTLKIRAGSDVDFLRFWVSLTGLLFVMLAGAGLASLYFDPANSFISLPFSGGGVLGYELSNSLDSHIDLLGTTLFLLFLFALGFSLLTSYSWLTIMDYTGLVTYQLYCLLKDKGMVSSKKIKQKIETEREKRQTRFETSQNSTGPTIHGRSKSLDLQGEVGQKSSTKKATKILSNAVSAIASKVATDHKVDPKPRNDIEPQITLGEAVLAQEAEQQGIDMGSDPIDPVKVGKRMVANETVPLQTSGALPSVDLLAPSPVYEEGFSEEELTNLSELLETRLKEFGVSVQVEAVQPGPVVTRFELLPAPGVKVSQINNLAKDLARVMSVKSVRVVDVIPGKSVVGIEIPNEEREVVSFRDVISSEEFQKSTSPLTVALGKDISGKPVVADVAKMPHLLVAGTTGSGKSVGVNSMILSLLYKSKPEDVRLIMVDPKMLELSVYEDIPHLLTPVVTDMSEAANALRWSVFEMDRRYQLMAKLGVRNIAGYNAKVKGAIEDGKPIIDPLYQQAANFGHELGEKPPTLEPLPYIVVVVDEFADMIMVVGKEVEQLIARIAQKARAAGIHLILATQRPSVNVITGLIKANIPTRISFMVNTKIDSRTILDQGGAEQLLGMGDMLFMPPGSGSPKRVHGAYMTDEEVHAVAEFVKSQGQPQYLETVTQSPVSETEASDSADAEQDKLYDEVVAFIIDQGRVSTSMVQRRFKIGYNRSARIVEAMEAAGIVSPMKSSGTRDVLVPKHES